MRPGLIKTELWSGWITISSGDILLPDELHIPCITYKGLHGSLQYFC